jgi:hypothetical protein
VECRRCSDCQSYSHHWLDNPDFGNDPADAEYPTGNQYICKHCDAVGDECKICDGSGECAGLDCRTCKSEGIMVAKPRTYEELERGR